MEEEKHLDQADFQCFGHILIRDLTTGDVLINQRETLAHNNKNKGDNEGRDSE